MLEMRKILRKNSPSLTNRTDQEKNRISQFEDKVDHVKTHVIIGKDRICGEA